MKRKDYEEQAKTLSIKFLQAKRDGTIPISTGWAEWCWQQGIYPLED